MEVTMPILKPNARTPHAKCCNKKCPALRWKAHNSHLRKRYGER